MQSSIRLLIFAAVTQLSFAAAASEELWTYYFVADGSRPYLTECYGDCNGGGTRADIAGNFSMVLNWQTRMGNLIEVDDQLVNVASWGTNFNNVTPYIPVGPMHGNYNGGKPPEFLPGNLISVGDHWELSSDGHIPLAGGAYRLATPYDITFSTTSASLSMNMGKYPLLPVALVTNAHATIVSKGLAGDFNFDGRVDCAITWRGGRWPVRRWTIPCGVPILAARHRQAAPAFYPQSSLSPPPPRCYCSGCWDVVCGVEISSCELRRGGHNGS